MTVTKTMNTGVSGLLAQQKALGVVGDNIANVNTVGFKGSRANFEDVLGGVAARRVQGPGAGVSMTRTQQIFSQGVLTNTGVPTDVALSGEGFFVVQGKVDGHDGQFFSRAGQMTVRNDGMLVNPQGLNLMGYAADPNGGFNAALTPIEITTAMHALAPKPTENAEIAANLDANAPVLTSALGPGVFDPADPVGSANFSTSMTVYDSLGNAHTLDVYFTKSTTANQWNMNVLAPDSTPSQIVTNAPVNFNTDGTLIAGSASGTVNFPGAAPGQSIVFDLGTAGLTDGLSQYGSPSAINAQSQDGYASAALTALDITTDGVVNGVYANGESIAFAQIGVAKFRANEGLARAGHNLWLQTIESGDAAISGASSGGRGAVVAGTLEQSNVDLATQFVDMITYQRAFSANAKTITTADELLMETMQLKR